MDSGMVSGICVDWEKLTIIMVPNAAPEKGEASGLPGGIIGRNESPFDALVREWKEEVWGYWAPDAVFFKKIKKNGLNGSLPHYQHLFFIEDTGRKIRSSGVRGETKAPARVKLWDIATGKEEAFFSHKLALLEFLEYTASLSAQKGIVGLSKEISHIAVTMDRGMKKIIKT